jgi:heat shock protein HtpX
MLNNLKTAGLLAGLAGIAMLIGSAWGRGGLYIGFGISLVMIVGSYWFSDKIAIASARAVPVTAAQMPEYYAVMTELTTRAEIPMPKLYVTPNPQPNAFATGRNPHHAAVAVTQGLLQALSWDEIRGVLAHEIGHVKNRDILTGSVAAAIATFITFAARIAMWGAMFGGMGGSSNDRDRNPIAELLLVVLGPIAAMIIQMAISRSREYAADASAARLIGTGEPLASALSKLNGYASRIPSGVDPAQAQAYIVNPLAGGGLRSLFATHPPVEERIRRLRDNSWA